jgi:hypothetical protein
MHAGALAKEIGLFFSPSSPELMGKNEKAISERSN